MINKLPRQQLLGQHRECCAMRGNGWGKKHATVDYVFTYNHTRLYEYHVLVMDEMKRRGYKPHEPFYNPLYRGEFCLPHDKHTYDYYEGNIYPEHDEAYYQECIDNLAGKGITIEGEVAV
jgi:uncharacterized protein (TIGR02328 family)